jgi:hypothetical protein
VRENESCRASIEFFTFSCSRKGPRKSAQQPQDDELGQPQATFNAPNTTSFGSIVNMVNLNNAIVSPIAPVGSGIPREIQLALRLEF